MVIRYEKRRKAVLINIHCAWLFARPIHLHVQWRALIQSAMAKFASAGFMNATRGLQSRLSIDV